MFKKISCFIMFIIMVLSMFSTSIVSLADGDLVQDVDLLFNGDMEWLGTSYNVWDGKHVPETKNIHGGSKSLKLTSTAASNDRQLYQQKIDGFVPGQKYTVSCWVYTDDLKGGNIQKTASAGMKVEIQSPTGILQHITLYLSPEQGSLSYGKWTYRETTFTCEEGATGTASIHVRQDGIGTVYYDDLKIVGPTTAEKAAEIVDKKARYQEGYKISMDFYKEEQDYANNAVIVDGANNLIKNPSFEDKSDTMYPLGTGALNWSIRSQYGNEVIYRDETVSRTGDGCSMKVHAPDTYNAENDPYVLHQIISGSKYLDFQCGEDFVGGAEYVLSAWIKTEDLGIGEGALFKFEPNGATASFTQEIYYTDGQWHQVKFIYTMPENTTQLNILARVSGTGTVWYDDLEFGRSSSNGYINFYSKHTFYYADEAEIEAFADFKTNIHSIETDSKVEFSLIDKDGTEVASQIDETKEKNVWKFPSSFLAVKQQAYTLKAEYIRSDGTVIETKSKRIYLYDRPKSMDAEGNLHDTETGEIIPPFFMYGAKQDTLGSLAEAGLNVLRIIDMTLSNDDIQLKLDAAHAKGMKVLVSLGDSRVAGHPMQIARTRAIVTEFKKHPAIAAWMMMDEPSKGVAPLGIQTYAEMLYYLEEAYKAIRAIDDVHPVYNIETVGLSNDTFERTGQLCDIFAIDPYPSSLKASISGSLQRATQRAVNAVYDERPVWILGLAASWSGTYGTPINSAMLRYQLYDSLWAGAKGAGHYLSDNPIYPNPTFTETYLSTFNQAKESGEIDEIFDHFSLGNSEVFNEGAGNGYQWRAWSKDNGDMFIAVRSKLAKDENNKDVVLDTLTTDIKLVSKDGKTIDGFSATLVNGASTAEPTVTSSTNEFTCTITAGEVSLYKIKKGYTLRNLTASSTNKSVTVEYDVTNNLTEGGTVIYAFYDAQGRFVKMKTEAAAFEGGTAHIKKIFNEEIDFASMKVFIWNSVTGMTSLSDMIEFIKE